MKKITDYDVVKSADIDALRNVVMKRIKDGWELVGGISLTSSFNKVYYAQALIKHGDSLTKHGEK